MRFLLRKELREQILRDRLPQEPRIGEERDGQKPRGRHRRRQQRPDDPTHMAGPAAVLGAKGESGKGDQHHEGSDRPLDEDGRPERGPKAAGRPEGRPACGGGVPQFRQRRHGENDGRQQHGIGLGLLRLRDQGRRGGEKHGRQEAGTAPEEAGAQGEAGEHGHPCAEHGRNAVRPDPRRLRVVERRRKRRLEPVDADGFLVARRILEVDSQIVAATDHLFRRLGETGLIPIQRRHDHPARQTDQGRKKCQKKIGPPALQYPPHPRPPALRSPRSPANSPRRHSCAVSPPKAMSRCPSSSRCTMRRAI